VEIEIEFTGGVKVEAVWNGQRVATDQPAAGGGEGSAPSPFDLFLASMGTCAGFYVLRYCQQHGLASAGIRLIESIHSDPQTGLVDRVDLQIRVPADFPPKYYPALVRAAEQCKVKQNLEHPPIFSVTTRVDGG
jgi:ribosomal protein S12 methylthiotransferase accessory factor